MLSRIFPETLNNTYRGHWAGLAILVIVLLGRLAITFNGTFNSAFVAASADGIPLSTFPPAAAQAVIALFALTAISNLGLCLLGLVSLLRYRAMLPLVYLLLVIQSVASRVILFVHPLVRTQTPTLGSAFILGLLALTVLGFALSLTPSSSETNAKEPLK